jgi:3-deoxy-manno-octulosonate cytidylyltransferase (CMP-KDO synthetase)
MWSYQMNAIGVIPARYKSTRLPGKPLADILGRPMVQWVYESAARSSLEAVIVAADDRRVLEAVEKFGGEAVLTSPDHTTGTDRVAEVAGGMNADIVVNIQGDEPFIHPGMIDEIVDPFVNDEDLPMCTSMHEITEEDDLRNPNVVKVVTDKNGFALYFSRSLVPYPRYRDGFHAYEHIGIYAFRKDFLMRFSSLDATVLEQTEALEQLRALEHGYRIKVIRTHMEYIPLSVDTEEDLEKARSFAKKLHREGQ